MTRCRNVTMSLQRYLTSEPEILLFDDTIVPTSLTENGTYWTKVTRAAADAGAEEFISNLPTGSITWVVVVQNFLAVNDNVLPSQTMLKDAPILL